MDSPQKVPIYARRFHVIESLSYTWTILDSVSTTRGSSPGAMVFTTASSKASLASSSFWWRARDWKEKKRKITEHIKSVVWYKPTGCLGEIFRTEQTGCLFLLWLVFPKNWQYIDGLMQDCGILIANALEIPQSCTKPSIWFDCCLLCFVAVCYWSDFDSPKSIMSIIIQACIATAQSMEHDAAYSAAINDTDITLTQKDTHMDEWLWDVCCEKLVEN